MIKFNWVRKSDGEPLTKIRITHTLTRTDLANLYAAATIPTTYDEMELLSKGSKHAIEEAIRDKLFSHRDDLNWWRDNYADEYDNEPTADEVFEWARKQIAKL